MPSTIPSRSLPFWFATLPLPLWNISTGIFAMARKGTYPYGEGEVIIGATSSVEVLTRDNARPSNSTVIPHKRFTTPIRKPSARLSTHDYEP